MVVLFFLDARASRHELSWCWAQRNTTFMCTSSKIHVYDIGPCSVGLVVRNYSLLRSVCH